MKDSERPYQQYICRACGLIYDEAEGDPDSGLAPGTRFEDIPDDWECPLCGVTKTDFELFEKRAAAAASAAGLQTTGIVVVGAGLAGWGVVEAIREHDAGVAITLICACTGDRYHKPELSVALSRGLTAKKLVRESARVARMNQDQYMEAYAQRTLGEIYGEQQRVAEARVILEQALALFRQLEIDDEIQRTEEHLHQLV